MVPRIWCLSLLVTVLPAIALARPAGSSASPAPAVTPPAQPATTASATAAARNELDRRAIFDILRGGATVQDVGFEQHLWSVAGSLAAQRWTPPVVTVRMVVAAGAAEKTAK